MSDYSVKAILSADVSGFTSAFKQAESAVGKFKEATSKITGVVGDTVQKINQHAESIGHSMQAAGAATSALGMKGLKSFGDFQASLNKAAVVAGGTSRDIKGLGDVANKMGKDLPLSAQDCANAMVGMARNGASLKELKETFPAIAKASTAAGEDIGNTADSVQQSMNIWGGSATKNAGILVQTANQSNASVGSMATAFANIGTTAKSLRMSLGTTSEAIGLLTNKGMTSERASQDLNHALVQMIKPSNAAKKVMKKLGISYTDAHGKMKPFRQILGELSQALQGYTPAQQKAYEATMFGTAGMSAIAPLIDSVRDKTGNASTSWDAYAAKQNKAAGTTKKAGETLSKQAKDMQNNVGSALEQVGGAWDDLNNSAMQANNKMLSNTLHMISSLLTHLQTGKDGISRFARAFMGLSPILGPVITTVGTFIANMQKIATLINPFTLIAGAIGALSLKVVAAYRASKPFREEVHKIAKIFEDTFGPALKRAGGYLGDLFSTLEGKGGKGSSQFKKLGDEIANTLKKINWKGIAKDLSSVLSNAIKTIQSFVSDAKKILATLIGGRASDLNWNKIADNVASAFNKALSFIRKAMADATKVIQGFIKSGAFKSIGQALSAIGRAIKDLIINFAKAFSGNKGGKNTDTWKSFGEAIGNVTKKLADAVKAFANFVDSIAKHDPDLFRQIGNLAKFALGFIALRKSAKTASSVVDTLKRIGNAGKKFYQWLKDFPNKWKKVKDLVSKGLKVLKGLPDKIKKVVNLLKEIPGKIMDKLSKIIAFVKNIPSKLAPIFNTIKGMFFRLTAAISANPLMAIAIAIAAITTALVVFFTQTKTGRKMWSNFVKWLKNVWKDLKKYCAQIWGQITKNVTNVVKNIKNGWKGITSWFSKLINNVAKIFKNWINWLENIPKSMLTIGKNIITGLINGIVSKAQDLWNKVKDVAGNITKAFKGILGIHSPSTVMRDQVGKYIGAGLIEGIESTTGDVIESAGKLARAAVPSLSTSDFTSKLNALHNQARSSLTGHFSQELNLASQPAHINLNLGGYNYRAFVKNITNQQNADLDLQERRY